jgi:hypothetical protein
MSVFAHFATLLGPVDPALAALWWLSAVVLAILLVYGWQRVGRRFQ